ncbi:15474_t:CDS:2, partial [Dentiscutata erythropus]
MGRSTPNTRTRRPPNGFYYVLPEWYGEKLQQKETYEQLALDVLNLHSQKHPRYRYRPNSRSNKAVPMYHPYMNTTPRSKAVPLYNSYMNTSSTSASYPTQMPIPQVNYQTTDLLSQSSLEIDLYQYYQNPCNN